MMCLKISLREGYCGGVGGGPRGSGKSAANEAESSPLDKAELWAVRDRAFGHKFFLI